MTKSLKITNKKLIHKGEPTPRVGTKSKTYPIKKNTVKMDDAPKQGDCGPIVGTQTKTKKIKVTRSDKDVRAVGQRQGADAKLFAKFGEAKHMKVGGDSATPPGRRSSPSRSPRSGSRRSRSPESPNTSTEVGAVTAALSEMLGAGPAARPGLGQQPFIGRDQRGVGGARDQNVRRARNVR